MKNKSKKLNAVAAGFLCLLTAGLTCLRAELVTLAEANFDVDPALEPSLSWITLASGGFNTNGVWDGIGRYDTDESPQIFVSVGHSAPVGSFSFGNDLVSVSARMRVISDDGFNGQGTSVDVIRNGWRWRMGITSAAGQGAAFRHINAANDLTQAAVPMDTSVFRTYTLVVTDTTEGLADLYVDDVLSIPDAHATDLGTGAFNGRVEFGDTSSQGGAEAEYDFVRVEGLQPIISAGPTLGAETALAFPTDAGVLYRLEAAKLPNTNLFSSTGAHIVGDGSTQRLFDPTGYSTGKIYRAFVVP